MPKKMTLSKQQIMMNDEKKIRVRKEDIKKARKAKKQMQEEPTVEVAEVEEDA